MKLPFAAVPGRAFVYLLHTSPLLIAVLLYAYSVRLPFFLDDGAHFELLTRTNGLSHWAGLAGFPYYRPIAFSIWKLAERLASGHDPVALHWLNVMCFGLAGVLLGQVARQAAPRPFRTGSAVMAGGAFVIFPFSYQAVLLVAALFHLTLALGMAACLWLALLWLQGKTAGKGLLLCWLAAFTAIFSHENGVLLLPLLAGLIIARFYGHLPPRRRLALLITPVGLVTFVYLVLWLRLSPQTTATSTEAFDVSLAALLQGLIYPVAALVRPLVTGDASPLALLLLTAGVLLFAALLTARYAPARPPLRSMLVYGLAWYGLAILPAATLLPAGYVLGQPRLALLASMGGSVFWGMTLAVFAQAGPRRAGRLAALAAAAVSVYVSLEFLAMRRADFLRLAAYHDQVLALMSRYNVPQAGGVLVNAPDYLTPGEPQRRFLLGTEGALFVDPAADYRTQFASNAALDFERLSIVSFRQIQRSAGFGFSAHPPDLSAEAVAERVRGAPYVVVTQFHGRDFFPLLAGGAALTRVPAEASLAAFPEFDFHLTFARASFNMDGRTITVETQWRAGMPAQLKLFVHVTCGGRLVGQADGYPWGDTYPFAIWQAGEERADIRRIWLDEPVASSCLRVYVGLYREADVTRLQAVNPQTGQRFEDDRFSVPVETEQ